MDIMVLPRGPLVQEIASGNGNTIDLEKNLEAQSQLVSQVIKQRSDDFVLVLRQSLNNLTIDLGIVLPGLQTRKNKKCPKETGLVLTVFK